MTIDQIIMFISTITFIVIPVAMWTLGMRPFISKHKGPLAHGSNFFISQIVDYTTIGKICKDNDLKKPITSKIWISVVVLGFVVFFVGLIFTLI